MINIDAALLDQLGLGDLPAGEKDDLLKQIYETLEVRVGMKLAGGMTEAQVTEFEAFFGAQDEAGALRWLEAHCPDYKQVVAQQFEALKAEIAASADEILAAAG